MRIRAGTLDLETVSVLGVNVRMLRNLNFGLGIYLAGLAGVLAVGQLGLQPTIGASLIMPSFVAIIVGGLGSLPGTLLGGLLIGVASGVTTVFFPSATRSRDLRDDGARAAGAAARPSRRGGPLLMGSLDYNKNAANVVVWLLLLAMPFWLPLVHGYVELGSRVVVLGLAAMALNFLLGYTGVLSFGHAAYFGLGAYGAAMTIRYLVPSTSLAIVVGTLVGTIAAAIIGPLIIRLRGVYFAMVTIAFGQVFFFIAFRWNTVTGGDDGLTGWTRLPLHLGFATIDIQNSPKAFYYLVLVIFAISVGLMAWILRSPFGRTLIAIRENERRARFLGIPVDQHIWMSWVISCCFVSVAGAMYALLNNFVDPRALYWTQSGDFVIMAVLGGMRSFWGPLIGAAIYVVLQDYLSSQTENWQSFIGLFFVLVVLFFPRGVLGMIRRKVMS